VIFYSGARGFCNKRRRDQRNRLGRQTVLWELWIRVLTNWWRIFHLLQSASQLFLQTSISK